MGSSAAVYCALLPSCWSRGGRSGMRGMLLHSCATNRRMQVYWFRAPGIDVRWCLEAGLAVRWQLRRFCISHLMMWSARQPARQAHSQSHSLAMRLQMRRQSDETRPQHSGAKWCVTSAIYVQIKSNLKYVKFLCSLSFVFFLQLIKRFLCLWQFKIDTKQKTQLFASI